MKVDRTQPKGYLLTMFRGSSHHTIDPKGRFIIPTRFRDVLKAGGGDGIMITNMDGALFGYTFNEWAEVENRILAAKSANIRSFKRFFLGNAHECSCDKQGRILVPKNLRNYADINKEIILAGIVDHFEIWSREKWEAENLKIEDALQMDDVREELIELGL